MYDLPKFRPQRAKSPSNIDEAYALAPATPDVPLRQLAEAMSVKGSYSKNCNIGSLTRCIRWPARLRSQGAK